VHHAKTHPQKAPCKGQDQKSESWKQPVELVAKHKQPTSLLDAPLKLFLSYRHLASCRQAPLPGPVGPPDRQLVSIVSARRPESARPVSRVEPRCIPSSLSESWSSKQQITMRLRNRKSPLLLLLLPSLAVAAALADKQAGSEAIAASDSASSARRYGTKDAPVDGTDGKPHAGPFVELDKTAGSNKDLPALKDRPSDPLVVDGKRIPDSHDGVMDDKNRQGPKKGTTGTEGGVSEKDKDRKMREKQTGEKVENKPPTPKEKPPLPHSDQERIQADSEAKSGDKTATDASHLEVRIANALPAHSHSRS